MFSPACTFLDRTSSLLLVAFPHAPLAGPELYQAWPALHSQRPHLHPHAPSLPLKNEFKRAAFQFRPAGSNTADADDQDTVRVNWPSKVDPHRIRLYPDSSLVTIADLGGALASVGALLSRGPKDSTWRWAPALEGLNPSKAGVQRLRLADSHKAWDREVFPEPKPATAFSKRIARKINCCGNWVAFGKVLVGDTLQDVVVERGGEILTALPGSLHNDLVSRSS
ncbi:hypothetical protein DFH09DRAFT_1093466 [Mycena vulgaris]|nr:hypothetical protein DFH09DRAFT_1093466 [Mycena vulgaris]